jgi:hypothetical protein
MPNWCNNTIEIEGTKEQINAFVSFLDEQSGKNWFNFFRPCPQELVDTVSGFVGEDKQSAHETQQKMNIEKHGHADWYSWSVDKWGTKWNCDAQDWMKVENPNEDQASVTFWFDSAWSPPTALYEFIESNSEFIVTASYLEEGMSFVGQFSGGIDECYEFSDLDSLEGIPEELVDEWNLAELVEQNEEWEDE